MIQIKIFTRKQYYQNKWGDKEYLDGGEGDNTLIAAALLTGKMLRSDEECIYTAYGKTTKEAQKSINNYLAANPEHPAIYRTEIKY